MGRTALVTGSSGLVGSELTAFLDARGWTVHGIDNDMRRAFFGENGSTRANLERLRREARRYVHHDLDIRDGDAIGPVVAETRPDLVVHCAGQPSHELARARPLEDFDVNARATLVLLEAARASCPEAPFVFMSTNKVYGDAPNELDLVERDTRFDYADPALEEGIDESCRVDASTHSLFGASKAAADLLVQEYGRTFGLPTASLRCGCLTGRNQAGVELHGFLAYLARAVREGLPYRILGHKGKQVRDNLHAQDVCTAVLALAESPRPAAVYNLGGGRERSVSILEAIARLEELTGRRLETEYVDEPRLGDHVCYVSDTRRLRTEHRWEPEVALEEILEELAAARRSPA